MYDCASLSKSDNWFKMDRVQCPAGEHCTKKERGDICLMWHPPSKPSTTEQSNLLSDQTYSEQAEEERLVQLAVMQSLEDQKLHCQFCKSEVSCMDDLHLHQLDCTKMEETGLSDVEEGLKEEKKLQRRSSRLKKPTEKYKAYNLSLAENERDLEENSDMNEVNNKDQEEKMETEGK